jgi:hypothetical protein
MSLLILGQYATASLAVLALVGALFRFLVLLPLKAFIKEQTYPIQPTANGGRSLPDVALGIEAIKLRLDSIERRVMRLEDTPKK